MSLEVDRISYTIQQAAQATGLSESEVRQAYRDGEFTVHHRGKRVLIRRDDLDAWVNGMPTERAS